MASSRPSLGEFRADRSVAFDAPSVSFQPAGWFQRVQRALREFRRLAHSSFMSRLAAGHAIIRRPASVRTLATSTVRLRSGACFPEANMIAGFAASKGTNCAGCFPVFSRRSWVPGKSAQWRAKRPRFSEQICAGALGFDGQPPALPMPACARCDSR
jgi:hypothetical protein